MLLEVGDDDLRDRHRPPAGVGLGRAEVERAVGELLVLLDDGDGAVEEIEVALAERAELPDPQAAERGEQHHRPVARLDRVGEGEHLLDRCHRPFRRPLDGGALDDARVPRNEAVLDRGRADGVEKAVALGDRRRPGRPALILAARHVRTCPA